MQFYNNKISELIEGQLPNFLQEEGPKFIKFIENYYQWLETSKIEVSVDGDLNLDFTQNSYNIVASKTINGGELSKKVYANLINAYPLNSGNYVFFVKEYNEDPNLPITRGFSSGDSVTLNIENLTTQETSEFQGSLEIVSYIQNASLSSKSLWNLQDIDRTLDEYVDFFMKEYLEGFPLSFPTQSESTDIDVENFKKFLIKNSKEFYQSKGTEDSFKFFFRAIFNEEIDLKYPKEELFKTSDNTFENSKMIFLKPVVSSIPNIVSTQIKGSISGSTSYVESLTRFKKGFQEVFKVVLNKPSINGEFGNGEPIEDEQGNVIGNVLYGGVDFEILESDESFTPESRFFINRLGEVVPFSDLSNSERGSIIELTVCEVNSGNITEIKHLGNDPLFNLDVSQIESGTPVIVDSSGCFPELGIKREVLASVDRVVDGEIIIKIDREGKGYIKRPVITSIGGITVQPSEFQFEFIGSDIGTIKTVKIKDPGISYQDIIEQGTEEDLKTRNPILRQGQIGYETDTERFKIGRGNLPWLNLSYEQIPYNPYTVFGPSYIDVGLINPQNKNLRIKLSSIFDDGGRFLNNKSFLSNSKVLQDSKYYQIFSYVIESSIQVSRYKDLLKRLIHPAGMEMFGNISLQSLENSQVKSHDLKTVIPVIIDGLKYYKLENLYVKFKPDITKLELDFLFSDNFPELKVYEYVGLAGGDKFDTNNRAEIGTCRLKQFNKDTQSDSDLYKLSIFDLKISDSIKTEQDIDLIGATVGDSDVTFFEVDDVKSKNSSGETFIQDEKSWQRHFLDIKIEDYLNIFENSFSVFGPDGFTGSEIPSVIIVVSGLTGGNFQEDQILTQNGDEASGNIMSIVDNSDGTFNIQLEDYDGLYESGEIVNNNSGVSATIDSVSETFFIDGGSADTTEFPLVISPPLSWDSMYQIYKNKYDNLVVGTDFENSFNVWDKSSNVSVSVSESHIDGNHLNNDPENVQTILNYSGTLPDLSEGDIITISTPKPVQKSLVLYSDVDYFLTPSNPSDSEDNYSGDLFFPNSPPGGMTIDQNSSTHDKIFSKDFTLIVKDIVGDGEYSVGDVITSESPPPNIQNHSTGRDIILKSVEDLANGEKKLTLSGYDYNLDPSFEQWDIKNQNDLKSTIVSLDRNYGVIQKLEESTDQSRLCFEIEDYDQTFNSDDVFIKKFVASDPGANGTMTVEFKLKNNKLIKDQLFQVKEIDSQSNIITTSNKSEVEISSSGSGYLNVLKV